VNREVKGNETGIRNFKTRNPRWLMHAGLCISLRRISAFLHKAPVCHLRHNRRIDEKTMRESHTYRDPKMARILALQTKELGPTVLR
jgi:predicted RNA-binding protein with PUA-like domain